MSGEVKLINGTLKVWLTANSRPVEFNFLTSVAPEWTDDRSTELTSDGERQIGAPNTGAEIQVEQVAYGKTKQQIKEQLRIFTVGTFASALWAGDEYTDDASDPTPYKHEYRIYGGSISRKGKWSAKDQSKNTMVLKANKMVELVDGYAGDEPIEGIG